MGCGGGWNPCFSFIFIKIRVTIEIEHLVGKYYHKNEAKARALRKRDVFTQEQENQDS